jgi:hypothetical protein
MMVDGMARLRSVNPATEEELASFAQHTAEDLDRALAEADAAQRDWERTPLEERAHVLVEIARLLRQRRPEYARLATMEMGKPIAEAEAEVDKCAWNCEFYAERGAQLLADAPVRTEAQASYVAYQPLGVVLAIMASVGEATGRLIADARLSAVTLTGSERAGAAVGAAAGRALKKCVLELGGSDPFIVLADADLPNVAEQAARARFANAGQSCIAAKRFIVEGAVAEEFEQRLVDATAAGSSPRRSWAVSPTTCRCSSRRPSAQWRPSSGPMTRRRPSTWPTTHPTAWEPVSGRATPNMASGSDDGCGPARCSSTAASPPTHACRSGGSSAAATAANWQRSVSTSSLTSGHSGYRRPARRRPRPSPSDHLERAHERATVRVPDHA